MTNVAIILATVAGIGIIDAIMVWALIKITAKENEHFDKISKEEFDSKH